MRTIALLVLILPATAQAGMLQVDTTYTNGQILCGPLTPDLTELPASVLASFTLNAETAGIYDIDDVVASSLSFGDGAWGFGDLESFSIEIVHSGRGLDVAALTYAYGSIDTPTVDGRLAGNFPLLIEGTDRATGDAFQYLYDTSSSTLTFVPEPIPEPSTLVLASLGFIGGALLRTRRRGSFRAANGPVRQSPG
jgi:hypothetical protein